MGLFGNLFDFNFDEKTTPLEELIGEEVRNQFLEDSGYDPDDFDF